MIVKMRMATYLPRLAVGASSDVTASAVNSQMPAPAPAMVVPASAVRKVDVVEEGEVHTDEHVHVLCTSRNDSPDAKKAPSEQSGISTTNKIGKRAHERADTCKGQEVAEDEPNPPVDATNIAIDIWWNGTEDVYWNLAASPEECHSKQTHKALECHL
jgi:hypothetical protein